MSQVMEAPAYPKHMLDRVPSALHRLLDLAYDMTWVWTPGTQALFERIDAELWRLTSRNPVRVLALVESERLAQLSGDREFLAGVERQHAQLRQGPNDGRWFAAHKDKLASTWRPFRVAYFCAEFGLTECFQIYSGGLGLLAGDHVRSAAQMGLPFVGVGLLYRNGYFHQALDGNGIQHELFPALDVNRQPVRRVLDESGKQLTVRVKLPGREVHIAVWRCDIGSARLYLLDTNLEDNAPLDRDITANLYLGDQTRRIEQEIVLGIGGVRVLRACDEHPTVFHMNEGHAAFLGLERIRFFLESQPNLSFDQAREAASPSHIFTTHTPVPAGIDRFNPNLVAQYFADYHLSLNLDLEGFLALGRENVSNKAEAFSMAVLAIRISKFCNGVSELHGEVSRRMWKSIWPGVPESDVPIGHVTNGVNTDFWVGPQMGRLYDAHLVKDWRCSPQDPGVWAGAMKIPDDQLWAARNAARRELIRYCNQQTAAGKTGGIHAQLDPDALTIGFARRFAGYKRGTLLMRDRQRLAQILSGRDGKNVQLIFAGKAHPGDNWGKHLIRDIVDFARSPMAHGRVLFLEDYAIDVARNMVQGCDVWLNNPIRGLEASGTSGMKAAMNGCLNASILDGWWDEAYQPDLGYEIPARGTYEHDAPDQDRDEHEARELYLLLEQNLIPDFHQRNSDLPTKWLSKVRRCIAGLSPEFSSHRMVDQYARQYYFPAHAAATEMLAVPDAAPGTIGFGKARGVAELIDTYRSGWRTLDVRIHDVSTTGQIGEYRVEAIVSAPGLDQKLLKVQAVHGEADASGNIEHVRVQALEPAASQPSGVHRYVGVVRIPTDCSHRYAMLIRAIPGDKRLVTPFIPGLIRNTPPIRLEQNSGVATAGGWGSTSTLAR